jgi:hypothetical protein
MLQCRPNDGSDGRFYTPDRDVAYLAVPLLHKVLKRLDDPQPFQRSLMTCLGTGIPAADVGEVARAVAGYFVQARDKGCDAAAAWERSGLAELERTKPAALGLVLAQVGRVFLPTAYFSIRDVAGLPGVKPFQGLDELVAAVFRWHDWRLLPWWVRGLARVLPESWGWALVDWAVLRRERTAGPAL